MKELMFYYFIFLAVACLLVALLVLRLKIKSPVRLIVLICILIITPVVIGVVISTYFNPLPETMVPNLIGKDLEEAIEIAEILDLEIKVETRAGTSEIITYQRPEEGRIVKVGRTVYVALGSYLPQPETKVATFEGEPEINEESEPME
jgi:beta-lactam-binding protein with PASTA domain